MATGDPQLPMFFHGIVPLDPSKHGKLKMQRGRDYGFARETNAVPIALHEAAAASADYPLVFGAKGNAALLAIVGYRDRENLFLEPDGAWRAGTYVPAYVRNYPFAFIETPNNQLVLGIDPQAALLGAAGEPLFNNSAQPSPPLNQAIELCKSLFGSLRATGEMLAALEARDLLVENSALIEFKTGGSARLGGFRVIDPQKFDALDDATFLDWRKRGWLGAIYAHFNAAGRWSRIVDLGAAALGRI
jgi:SapC